MSTKPYKGFEPKWVLTRAPENSYRSIFRWGDPDFFKYPKEALYKYVKERCNLSDDEFRQYNDDIGMDPVVLGEAYAPKFDAKHVAAIAEIVGEKNVSQTDYDRLAVAYGQTMYDLLRMRHRRFDSLPDLVVFPETSKQIEQIVAYVTEHKLHKVLKFIEVDQTITVQAGMSGPKLEETLQNAKTIFGAKRAYTCGHFPQSFEYSSVGGWTVTRGAGQNSTYYGTIADIVLSQKYATPIGVIETSHYSREATGPNLNQIMMGGEGTFGVLTEVTLKIFRWMPENRKRFSYMFKNWATAREAAREMMQCECGFSSVFRLSDAEETSLMLHLYNVDETPLEPMLNKLGYQDFERCLFLGFTDGEKGFSKNVARNIMKIALKHGGIPMTGLVCKGWEKGRFNDPYLRDTLMDFGFMIDTLECTVNWSNMGRVHREVREVCHALPNTIVTTHMSHCYPQGANLYFIFMTKMQDEEEFRKYHATILDAIQKSGAAISHHHGIGKMFAPWLEGYLGEKEYGVIRTLKDYFDPDYVMNPGGTIGLDLKPEEKKFLREHKEYVDHAEE